MHKYAKGDTIDFDDEEGAESWLLWAQVGLGLRRQPHGELRAEPRAARRTGTPEAFRRPSPA